MLLTNLMRYRTQNHEHTEDYVSTVFAALLNRDLEARAAVIAVFRGGGWNAPRDLAPLRARTQVRAEARVKLLIPDVVLNCDRWRAVIEAKIKQDPTEAQLEAYSELGPDKVALIAPESKLGMVSDRWPKASWQAVWVVLQQLPPSRDPVAQWLRGQLADLLASEGQAGRWNMPGLELLKGALAVREMRRYNEAIGRAVLGLYRTKGVRCTVDGPLSASWTRPQAPDGEVLLALGLEAEQAEGVEGYGLEWSLWVQLEDSSASRLDRTAWAEFPWTEAGDGWFWAPLADSLELPRHFGIGLDIAVESAARVLATLLDGAGGDRVTVEPEPCPVAFPDGALALHTRHSELAYTALKAWEREALRMLEQSLRGAGLDATLRRDFLGITVSGRPHLWVWSESKLHPRKLRLSVGVSWARVRDRKHEMALLVDSLGQRSGFQVKRRDDDTTLRVDFDLLKYSLEEAAAGLAQAVSLALVELLARPDTGEER